MSYFKGLFFGFWKHLDFFILFSQSKQVFFTPLVLID